MTFHLRPPTDADLPRLVELGREEAEGAGQHYTATEEQIRNEWDAPGQDRERFERVVEVDGKVVGTGGIWLDETVVHLGGYVSPAFRRNGIGQAIYRWGMETVETIDGVDEILVGHRAGDADAERFVGKLPGFQYERSFLRMRNDAPAQAEPASWEGGLALYEPSDRIGELVTLRNESFVDHWNFHAWKREGLERSVELGEEDPSLWFFASVDGTPAGVCRNVVKRDGDGVPHGYLGPIGTLTPFRGRGVAKALLRQSLETLAARGCATVTLWVDSQNPFDATRLYAANGFAVQSDWRVFRRDRR